MVTHGNATVIHGHGTTNHGHAMVTMVIRGHVLGSP